MAELFDVTRTAVKSSVRAKCKRCKRPILTARSIKRGYGEACWKKLTSNLQLDFEDKK